MMDDIDRDLAIRTVLVLCVVETADGKVELYQWGDVDHLGDIGLLEAAKVELANGTRE